MKKTLLSIVASVATFFGVTLQSFGVSVSNPLIYSDVPDPSVIRDGNKYYMVSTTMHCAPGVPIMMSEDLSNWRTVNYAYQTLDNGDNQSLNGGKHAYGKGSWASSLRKHKNKYYILTPSYTTGKTHLFSTDDIENGTWDEVRLPFYHDPSLFFDDDDRAYIIFGSGEFNIIELNSDLKSVKGGASKLNIPIDQTTGTNGYIVKCEGAHMEKVDGRYYLFAISWPNGKCRTELVFRSSSLKGNYEGKIALQENGVAQGGIFDTPDGKWYAMLFRDSGGVGRIPWLIPVSWENGWPNMGRQAARSVDLPNPVEPAYSMATSDDFESTTLPLEWQWNHNPDNSKWSLSARPGYLRITTGRTDKSLYWAKNTLTQKTFGPKCSGRVALDVKGMKDGDIAGLAALQDSFGFVGVQKQWGQLNIIQQKTDAVLNFSIINPTVLIGMFIGAMLVFVFAAVTMNGVERAAQRVVVEVRRQFAEIPGILEGTATPEYAKCVSICTHGALKEMVVPAVMAVIVPIATGVILGPTGVVGLLAGVSVAGFAVSVFMSNAGGAWDNAKKYIEEGHFGGKGSKPHKASVVGDTIGDPFKDTSGPSLNILIKLCATVSIVFSGLVAVFHLL